MSIRTLPILSLSEVLLLLALPVRGGSLQPSGKFQHDCADFKADSGGTSDDGDIRCSGLGPALSGDSGAELRVECDLKANTWTDAFAQRTGVDYAYAAGNGSLANPGFGHGLADVNADTGIGARATWVPWRRDDALLHPGAAVASEEPDSDVSFRASPLPTTPARLAVFTTPPDTRSHPSFPCQRNPAVMRAGRNRWL